jgi:hypothetical protein
MKVLKPGKPPVWTLKATCTGHLNGGGGCNALLEVEQSDLRYYPGVSGDSWGSRPAQVMFKCCECGVITSIAPDDWPRKPSTLPQFTNEWRDARP